MEQHLLAITMKTTGTIKVIFLQIIPDFPYYSNQNDKQDASNCVTNYWTWQKKKLITRSSLVNIISKCWDSPFIIHLLSRQYACIQAFFTKGLNLVSGSFVIQSPPLGNSVGRRTRHGDSIWGADFLAHIWYIWH